MRIKVIELQSYGSFSDRRIDFQSDGMSMILGPNEAGKSTILAFIRTMLYGWNKKSMTERYEPHHRSMMSGRLTVTDDLGGTWVIERQERSSGLYSMIQHIDAAGHMRECKQHELEQELLGGLQAHLFRNVFAVTLDELHAIHTLQGDELRSLLYDAGIAAGRSIADSERLLQLEMDKLYKVRGRTQLLHETIKQLHEADRGKRDQDKMMKRLEQAELEWKQEREGLEQLLKQRESERQELAVMERALHVSEMWVKLLAVQRELMQLPDLSDWQYEVREQESELSRRIQQVNEQRDRLEAQIIEYQALLADEEMNEGLLQAATEVKRLAGMQEQVEHWRESLHDAQMEEDAIQDELARLAQLSGMDWSAEQLLSSDMSQSVMEQIREYERGLEAAGSYDIRSQEQLQRSTGELRFAEETKQQAVQKLDHAQHSGILNSGYAPAGSDIPALLRRWDEVQQLDMQLQRLVGQQPVGRASVERSSQQGRSKPLLAAVSLAGIGLLTAAALFFFGEQIGAVVTAVISMLAAGGVIWSGKEHKQSSPINDETRLYEELSCRYEEQLQALENELKLVLARVNQPLQLSEAGTYSRSKPSGMGMLQERQQRLQRLDAALDAVSAWAREREQLTQRAHAAEEAWQTAERRYRAAAAEASEAQAEADGKRAEWQRWLEAHALPALWSPAGAQEHARRVEQARELARKRERLQGRSARIRGEYDAYRASCERVLAACAGALTQALQQPLGSAAAETAAALHAERLPAEAQLARLLAHVERAEAAAAAHEQRAQALAALDAELRRCEQSRETLAEARERLWRQAGADDAASFARLAQQAERYARCQELQRELEAACYRGGDRASFAPYEALLMQYDAAALEQRCREFNERLESLDLRIREAEQQTGRLRQESDRLRTEAEHEQWGQRTAELESVLDQQASRYMVHALARQIIASARQKYEQEKQPYVYRRAGQYLSQMTAGRYIRVLSPLGTQQLAVQHMDGRILDTALLSRGTMEQVYLAMRLALSDVMSERTHLPFIWDDVFVNFDPNRLQQTLQVLPELMNNRQIIWTTCHPHMVEAAKRSIDSVQVIEL